ncbi:MaoC family dehydratase N-terminal domain-containing protein [Pseudonocardia sp. MH-G8]|uniref:MaoC family dehydratase N-terminal domain-containing protein n=1 Tax=Pseudonocardia sp. MH-G8 TaxID=1854588 RepID=UPI000BA0C731|nr:MaoC family dehydratase N-terminal domain-containing protein [Pseudonocardia sp. MH-G8]OZM78887.1 acyl dehydratase [Pseudonocardia sp. MH-G8]
MAIDPALVGTTQPALVVEVERGQLRAFAHAIGETDPVYVDLDAARAAGHPDLPVPPTFLFGLGLGRGGDFAWLTDLGVDLRHVLHGEQEFAYHQVAHAGDTLTLEPRISDVFSKRAGALQFLVRDTAVHRDGAPVAELRETLVVRDPAAVTS